VLRIPARSGGGGGTWGQGCEPRPLSGFSAAIGYDNAGNVTETADREIYIGVDPPASEDSGGVDETAGDVTGSDETDEGTPATEDDGSGEDDGGTGGAEAGVDVDRGAGDGGCGCRSSQHSPVAALGLVVVLGLLRSRRR